MVDLGQVTQPPPVLNTELIEIKAIDTLLEEAWDQRTKTSVEDYIRTIDEIKLRSCEVDYAVGNDAYIILRSTKYKELKETQQALSNLENLKISFESRSASKSASIPESTPAPIWLFRLYVCLGSIYFDLKQTDYALDCARKQLDLAQQLKNDRYAAAATLSIGRLHAALGNTAKALSYYGEAEKLFEKVTDHWGISITLLNTSALYRETGMFQLCEYVAKKCLLLATNSKNLRSICFSYLELGYCAAHKKSYDKAKAHFERALSLAKELDLSDEIIESCLQLALIPDKTTYQERLTHIEKATELATTLNDKSLLSLCYETLAKFHKQFGNFQDAFKALEKHMALKEVWLEESNKRSLNNALVVFETEKAQQEAEVHRLKAIELQETVSELEELNLKVRELSIRDSLTGLFNRRHLEEQVHPLFEQSLRYNKAISICLLDIDNFKKINDQFSHQIGDAVLQQFAQILQAVIRSADVVARYGGEEFIILMPETNLNSGHQLAERLRLDIENFDWTSIAPELKVTASFGLSSIPADVGLLAVKEQALRPDKLISLADKRLYIAKNSGRNRVCSSCTPPPT